MTCVNKPLIANGSNGETIGQAALRNWNNTGEYDRSESSIHGSITLSLMGDPTLTMNIVQPASNVTATPSNGQMNVNWSGNALAYRVYRASSLDGDFEFVGETSKTSFTDPSPGTNHLYLVRAVRFIESRSGSYLAGSTGIIADANSRTFPGKNPPTVPFRGKSLTIKNVMSDLEDWIAESAS